MSTGLETWNQSMLEIGAAYPFVGSEMLLALVGLASWVIWHVIQFKAENKTYEEEKRAFSDKERLKKAMKIAKIESLAHRMDGHDL